MPFDFIRFRAVPRHGPVSKGGVIRKQFLERPCAVFELLHKPLAVGTRGKGVRASVKYGHLSSMGMKRRRYFSLSVLRGVCGVEHVSRTDR